MALDPLATTFDLDDRNISVPANVNVTAILASASAAVRDAAGCQITFGTSTVILVTDDPFELDLPAGPVASVASVTVAGTPVTGWAKVGDTLLMPCSQWWADRLPVEVTVTYDHGYPVIPADIIDLVCAVTAMAFANAGDDYGSQGRLGSFKLGEFAESYIHPAGTESLSPVALPDAVRNRLRARFSGSAAMVAVGMR